MDCPFQISAVTREALENVKGHFLTLESMETLFLTAGRFSQALKKTGMREEELSFRASQKESHSSSVLVQAMRVPGSEANIFPKGKH